MRGGGVTFARESGARAAGGRLSPAAISRSLAPHCLPAPPQFTPRYRKRENKTSHPGGLTAPSALGRMRAGRRTRLRRVRCCTAGRVSETCAGGGRRRQANRESDRDIACPGRAASGRDDAAAPPWRLPRAGSSMMGHPRRNSRLRTRASRRHTARACRMPCARPATVVRRRAVVRGEGVAAQDGGAKACCVGAPRT